VLVTAQFHKPSSALRWIVTFARVLSNFLQLGDGKKAPPHRVNPISQMTASMCDGAELRQSRAF
jgi:hypothetical protein